MPLETPLKKAKMTVLASVSEHFPKMKQRLELEALLKFAYDDPEAAEKVTSGGHSQVQGDALEQVQKFYQGMMEEARTEAVIAKARKKKVMLDAGIEEEKPSKKFKQELKVAAGKEDQTEAVKLCVKIEKRCRKAEKRC